MNSKGHPVFLRYWGSHFKNGRQVESVVRQYRLMAARGWQCYLGLERPPDNPEWTESLRLAGVQLRCLPRARRNFDWDCVRRIRALCRETGCTIFHCDNMHTSPLLGAFLAGVPVRVWCKRSMNAHYEEVREAGWKERLAMSTRLSYRLATCVVAVSGAVRDELTAMGAPKERVIVVSNPRPDLRVHAGRNEARSIYRYREDDVVIVTVGHSVPVKGWDLLLEAFMQIAPIDTRVRLLLVGSTTDGYEEQFYGNLRARVAGTGLESRIHFTGRVSEVGIPLAAGDIFALPSHSEGCCNALLEAMEAGLPCVATNVGNAADVIDSGVNGFTVPRNNPAEFAKILLAMVQDDQLRASLREKTALPPTVLTKAQHAQRMTDLYRELLAMKRPAFLEVGGQEQAGGNR